MTANFLALFVIGYALFILLTISFSTFKKKQSIFLRLGRKPLKQQIKIHAFFCVILIWSKNYKCVRDMLALVGFSLFTTKFSAHRHFMLWYTEPDGIYDDQQQQQQHSTEIKNGVVVPWWSNFRCEQINSP